MVDANRTLAEFARGIDEEPLVVPKGGKPVVVLMPLTNTDLETVSLSSNPRFLAFIERSRSRLDEDGGVTPEELRRQLGL